MINKCYGLNFTIEQLWSDPPKKMDIEAKPKKGEKKKPDPEL